MEQRRSLSDARSRTHYHRGDPRDVRWYEKLEGKSFVVLRSVLAEVNKLSNGIQDTRYIRLSWVDYTRCNIYEASRLLQAHEPTFLRLASFGLASERKLFRTPRCRGVHAKIIAQISLRILARSRLVAIFVAQTRVARLVVIRS